jgi:hypothetical protein
MGRERIRALLDENEAARHLVAIASQATLRHSLRVGAAKTLADIGRQDQARQLLLGLRANAASLKDRAGWQRRCSKPA